MPSTADSLQSLRLAIIGGGIGGICTALGLLQHPHIDVQIYEATSGFGEIGAGIAVSENARRALKLIAPAASAAFDKVATTNMWPEYKKRMATYIVVSSSPFLKVAAHSIRLEIFFSRVKASRRAKSWIFRSREKARTRARPFTLSSTTPVYGSSIVPDFSTSLLKAPFTPYAFQQTCRLSR